jgi:RNA polymerase sigma factor (TIGR02999 family)
LWHPSIRANTVHNVYNALMTDVTRILNELESGNAQAAQQLLPLVYEELRKLASANLAGDKPTPTLQPTMLVHEAYIRLVDQERPQRWNGRGHFFGAAAEAMRRILVEHARRRASLKRGGRFRRKILEEVQLNDETDLADLLALDEALVELEELAPEKAKLVKLRYFAGLTTPEAARALGVSLTTAERHWRFARTWLFARLCGDTSE